MKVRKIYAGKFFSTVALTLIQISEPPDPNPVCVTNYTITIRLLYGINYWDYHGLGSGQRTFYIHEMRIL